MNSKVSIILLNYNGLKFNKDCINSILRQNYKNFEVIFVDNNSTDGSLKEVERDFSDEIKSNKIIVVKNSKNTGFTGGNNLGVTYCNHKSEYICLLNNDVTVPQNRLEELVKGIESDKKLGAVGSLILDKGYEKEIYYQIFEKKQKFMLSVFGETVLEPIKDIEIKKGILGTNGLSGCCIMYKKSIIKTPFEEYYFAYAEDVYLSWRILLLGYSLGYCTNSIVHHFGSGSFGKKPSDLKLFHGNKNQIINFLLFYDIKYKILLFPLFITKELCHLFVGNSISRIKAKRKSWVWIITNRKIIQRTKENMKKETIINNKKFIEKLHFKLSDAAYFNKQKKTIEILLKTINGIFIGYGKIVKLLTILS